MSSLVSLPWSRLGDAEVSCLGKVAAFEFENALLFKIKCVKTLAERPESSLNFAYTNRTRCQESTVQISEVFVILSGHTRELLPGRARYHSFLLTIL